MTTKYKALAKELHPDMPTGDTEKFKQLNIAHKILKRELT
ncbi:MAG: DnaJ domain-containing protein [Candidatus Methanoperedens sp.]|nr:DnaJ domain-containing protein [Candidatus Methanoperedens sp.]